jgi:hypothetical protein
MGYGLFSVASLRVCRCEFQRSVFGLSGANSAKGKTRSDQVRLGAIRHGLVGRGLAG